MPYYCGRCGHDVTGEWAHWRDYRRGLPLYPASHMNWYMDHYGNWTHCLCCQCKFIYDIDHKIEELREVLERIEAAVAVHNQLMAKNITSSSPNGAPDMLFPPVPRMASMAASMVWGEYDQLNQVRSSRTGQ